jgi:hypothetical protein
VFDVVVSDVFKMLMKCLVHDDDVRNIYIRGMIVYVDRYSFRIL